MLTTSTRNAQGHIWPSITYLAHSADATGTLKDRVRFLVSLSADTPAGKTLNSMAGTESLRRFAGSAKVSWGEKARSDREAWIRDPGEALRFAAYAATGEIYGGLDVHWTVHKTHVCRSEEEWEDWRTETLGLRLPAIRTVIVEGDSALGSTTVQSAA